MAITKVQADRFSNQIIVQAVESAANTLTFQQLPQMTSLLEKRAMLINRIDYVISTLTELKADTERMHFGITMSSQWATVKLDEPAIIDYNTLWTHVQTAVGYIIYRFPITKDFANLPGGGILLPTRPTYLYVQGSGLANPQSVTARIYFTVYDLAPADYWDLVESVSPLQ